MEILGDMHELWWDFKNSSINKKQNEKLREAGQEF